MVLRLFGRLLFGASVLALIVWSFHGVQFDLSDPGKGLKSVREYLGSMVPHTHADWLSDRRLLPDLWQPLRETIQMAICGTTLGTLAAFPASFLAARTGAIWRPISNLFKTVLNMARAVPTMVVALVVVSAIGLGTAAGALAIGIVTFVSLTKQFAEALESVSVSPVEAVRACGGNAAQVFVYAMLPQVFPLYLSMTLYALEYNLRDSFIVGIVGAGGLGFELLNDIREYKLLDVGVIIALIVVLVNGVDYLSYRLRLIVS